MAIASSRRSRRKRLGISAAQVAPRPHRGGRFHACYRRLPDFKGRLGSGAAFEYVVDKFGSVHDHQRACEDQRHRLRHVFGRGAFAGAAVGGDRPRDHTKGY